MSVKSLFSKGDLSSVLRANEQKALEAVKDLPAKTVLATSEEDLVDQLYEKHKAEPLQLHPEVAESTPIIPTKIDLNPALHGYAGHVEGSRVEWAVPFDGEKLLFDLRPSQFTYRLPLGDVRSNEVAVVYEGLNPATAETINSQLDAELAVLTRWVDWSSSDCRAYNERLRSGLVRAVAEQREKVRADQQIEAALKVPVTRSDAPSALVVDIPKRKKPLSIAPRSAPGGHAAPDWAITKETFAEILAAISAWGLNVERHPDVAGPMGEEMLRDTLLLVLNREFGSSGGEMFSRSGDTDIAVMHESGAVFIAECKFWTGEKDFGNAIDQLLGYLIWRDTKSAILLFVREKNVTAIQAKARNAFGAHPRHKRQAPDVSGCPVFILHHEGDVNKEIEVALVVVAIPPGKGGSAAGRPTDK